MVFIFFIVAGTAGIIYSCSKDKLDQPALGPLSEDELANKKGVEGLLIGAYSLLDGMSTNPLAEGAAASNWVYGSICGSEAHKGGGDLFDKKDMHALETFQPTAENEPLLQKWVAVYDGIERTNTVLRMMRNATDMSALDTTEISAEARFLRALYYFEAKKIWNNIPFADEDVTYGAGNYFIKNDTSWAMIENDLLYAMHNLPVIQGEVGRCNKYAAEAYLAKCCMFEHKYEQAKSLLEDLIDNGETAGGLKYALLDRYADNFNPVYKNNSESVFAAQMSVQDGAYGLNGNTGDWLNFPFNIGYDFFKPSQYLVNHFKTSSNGLPDPDNYNKDDVTIDTGGADFAPYTGYLDPRLDWTVGRRGIPYLDWGIHPGMSSWTRNPVYGPYNPVKNVFYQKNLNEYTSASESWAGPTFHANNVDLVRFADVILWAAEVEVEIGSLDKAEECVNRIRNRMADNHVGWVHKYLDDNNPQGGSYTDDAHLAANYFIKPYPDGYFSSHGKDLSRRAVQYERILELGMEGHRFFDLVRWGIANTEINTYLLKEKNLRTYLNGVQFTPNKNEYFPIPQTEIDKSNGSLRQNPGY